MFCLLPCFCSLPSRVMVFLCLSFFLLDYVVTTLCFAIISSIDYDQSNIRWISTVIFTFIHTVRINSWTEVNTATTTACILEEITVILISKLLKHHSRAKHGVPAHSQELQRIIHSFMHLEDLCSALSRNLLGSVPSPTTTVIKISFEQLVEQRLVSLWQRSNL